MIVVFDDMCNVCTAFTRFLAQRDHSKRLTFVPAGSERGREWLVTSGQDPDDPATMIVVDGDARRLRSDAVLAAIGGLGGRWRAVRVFGIVPRGVRDAFYTGFARRRYRWFGRTTTCATCHAAPRREA